MDRANVFGGVLVSYQQQREPDQAQAMSAVQILDGLFRVRASHGADPVNGHAK